MIHAGDAALNAVLGHFSGIYRPVQAKIAEWVKAYLKSDPRIVFSGRDWIRLKKRIARELTRANIQATDIINGALEEAFAAGMSEAAYTISRSMWPITAAAVARLVLDGAIRLNTRTLNRDRDMSYGEDRVDTSAHSAVYTKTRPERMHQVISERIIRIRMNEMSAIARASVYGASDTGAYHAGLEAEKLGIETEKTWLSMMDMRVRASHKFLNRTTVPIDGVFHGYHGDLRYPHDPKAPPEETMRCRCRMVVHQKGEIPEEYTREVIPSETGEYVKWRDAQIRRAGSALELAKRHERMLR